MEDMGTYMELFDSWLDSFNLKEEERIELLNEFRIHCQLQVKCRKILLDRGEPCNQPASERH